MKSTTVWAKCGRLALADFGVIRTVATVWERSFPPQKKRKHCSQNFQVMRLQAAITLQWLQIAGNSRPNGPSTRCLVSIFTVRMNSKSFPWDVRSVQERYLLKFSAMSNVRYYISKPTVCRSVSSVTLVLKFILVSVFISFSSIIFIFILYQYFTNNHFSFYAVWTTLLI